jgi:hypothetical protein
VRTLVDVAKPIILLLCILSLYAVFHTAFLIPGRTVHDRIWDSLHLLVLAAGISFVAGQIFREGEAVRVGLAETLPVQIFWWAVGIMVALFLASWYLETYCIFYRDVRRF